MNRSRRFSRALVVTAALGALFGVAARPAFAAGPTMSECLSANESAIQSRADRHLRQSREQSIACAAPSCPREVRAACQTRVAQLSGAIPTVVFEVKDGSGTDLTGVALRMDGQPLVARLDGTAVAVDPGEHIFAFSAPGQPTVEKHFVLYEGALDRHESIVLDTAPVAAVPPPAPPASSSGLGARKLVGLTLGGAGVAGIAVGSIFGVMAFSSWSSAGIACGPGGPSHCSRASSGAVNSDHDRAVTDGTVSTVAFIAGGALVAAGVALFLTGGTHEHEARTPLAILPSLGPGQAGIALSGAF